MARADYACERCGHTDRGIERHHRKRRRDGGESFQNLVALCAGPDGCHAWAHAHPALARRYGWIVSVNRDPIVVPVLWRNRQWVLLTEEGGFVDAFLFAGFEGDDATEHDVKIDVPHGN